MASKEPADTSPTLGGTLRDNLAPTVAIMALLAFAIFVIYMLRLIGTDDIQWARAIYLFAGSEAIAFAAAGFFFGSQVHRQRAEAAEERADRIEERVSDAEKEATREATKGRAVAEAIKAKAAAHGVRPEAYSSSRGDGGDVVPESVGAAGQSVPLKETDWMELADLVNRLYP